MQTTAKLGQHAHIPALDGVRGAAVLAVIIYHTFMFRIPTGLAEKLLLKATGLGWVGVDIFFVLSGFLITGILLDARGQRAALPNFFIRRSLRIFPLSALALAIFFFVLPLLPGTVFDVQREYSANQGWFWGHMANNFMAFKGWAPHGFIGTHFWSLAIEEQFYLVWPFLVLAIRRGALVRACWLLIGASLLARIAAVDAGSNPVAYLATFCRLDGLATGGLVAALARGQRFDGRWGPRVAAIACAGLALVMVVERGMNPTGYGLTLGITLVNALTAGVICALVSGRGPRWVHAAAESRTLRFFGKYSFGLYVYHPAIEGLWVFSGAEQSLRAVVPGLGGFAYTLIGGALVIAAAIAVAMLSWAAFEAPILSLKSRLVIRPSTRPQPVAPAPAVPVVPAGALLEPTGTG